jgi:hypothetical protein
MVQDGISRILCPKKQTEEKGVTTFNNLHRLIGQHQQQQLRQPIRQQAIAQHQYQHLEHVKNASQLSLTRHR